MDGLKILEKRYQMIRTSLFISLVFFLIGLFALVSRWSSAIPIIIFACIFRLAAVWYAKKRYRDELIRQNAVASGMTSMQNVAYTLSEKAPESLLTKLGFIPDISLVPGAALHHVLRGSMNGKNVTVAETAFVSSGSHKNVSGTLLTAENVLSAEEQWVFLWRSPFYNLITQPEYIQHGWSELDSTDFSMGGQCVLLSPGGATETISKAIKVLLPFCKNQGVGLAARDGNLSLFLNDTFYIQNPDITKAPDGDSVKGDTIVGIEVIDKICKALEG